MRSIFLVFIACLMGWILINMFAKNRMKEIALPKASHNNTIAQAPIFEAMEDGKAYIEGRQPKYCDEMTMPFTCYLRFGYSMNVSDRIAENKLLDSCEEGVKAQKEDIEFCISQLTELYGQLPYKSTHKTNIVEICENENSYIPECDLQRVGEKKK